MDAKYLYEVKVIAWSAAKRPSPSEGTSPAPLTPTRRMLVRAGQLTLRQTSASPQKHCQTSGSGRLGAAVAARIPGKPVGSAATRGARRTVRCLVGFGARRTECQEIRSRPAKLSLRPRRFFSGVAIASGNAAFDPGISQ